MNEIEVKALLVIAMGYDNRKMPGRANIEAWMEQATRNGWTFETAREAIHRFHESASGEFLMPGHITGILNEVRAQIRKKIADDVCDPPRELRDDPRAEIEWRRRRYAEFTERAMQAWARREEIPDLEQPALEGHERLQLGPALRHLAEGAVVPVEHRPSRPARPRPSAPADPARRARVAKARAELDAIDPAEVQARAAESLRRAQREAS